MDVAEESHVSVCVCVCVCREPISTWNKGARKMYKKWKENPPDWYAEQRGLYYL